MGFGVDPCKMVAVVPFNGDVTDWRHVERGGKLCVDFQHRRFQPALRKRPAFSLPPTRSRGLGFLFEMKNALSFHCVQFGEKTCRKSVDVVDGRMQ